MDTFKYSAVSLTSMKRTVTFSPELAYIADQRTRRTPISAAVLWKPHQWSAGSPVWLTGDRDLCFAHTAQKNGQYVQQSGHGNPGIRVLSGCGSSSQVREDGSVATVRCAATNPRRAAAQDRRREPPLRHERHGPIVPVRSTRPDRQADEEQGNRRIGESHSTEGAPPARVSTRRPSRVRYWLATVTVGLPTDESPPPPLTWCFPGRCPLTCSRSRLQSLGALSRLPWANQLGGAQQRGLCLFQAVPATWRRGSRAPRSDSRPVVISVEAAIREASR